MADNVYVSHAEIASAIMQKISDSHPGYSATVRQYNAIYQAARMVSSALAIPDTRSIPGEGLEAWLMTDDVGNSSRFMASVLSDSQILIAEQAHPKDPGDFMRCRKLLEAAPELAECLPIMADVSLVWESLIANWDELCSLMDEEAPNWRSGEGSCPKTFARLKKLSV